MIRLSPQAEPEIYATTQMFATVLENVVMDPRTRELDFDDASLAENSRACYPIEYIPNASRSGRGGQPKDVGIALKEWYLAPRAGAAYVICHARPSAITPQSTAW